MNHPELDEPYEPHAPNGDPQTDTDLCHECHQELCECDPDDCVDTRVVKGN